MGANDVIRGHRSDMEGVITSSWSRVRNQGSNRSMRVMRSMGRRRTLARGSGTVTRGLTHAVVIAIDEVREDLTMRVGIRGKREVGNGLNDQTAILVEWASQAGT